MALSVTVIHIFAKKLFSLTPSFMSVVTIYKYMLCALASFCVTGFDIIGPPIDIKKVDRKTVK